MSWASVQKWRKMSEGVHVMGVGHKWMKMGERVHVMGVGREMDENR